MPPEILPALAQAANSQGLLREIYGDLLKPGVAQVGKALSTVVGLGNTILWPVQLLNERGCVALKANVDRYREKLEAVPVEDITPVPPEIGVPIADKLAYVHDIDLRELYTNLLVKASINKSQSEAHPSFVNIINNLSPDEAVLLQQFKDRIALPFFAAKWLNPDKNHWIQITDLSFEILDGMKLKFPSYIVAYVSNLEGLGLLKIRRDIVVVPESVYEPLEQRIKDHLGETSPPPDHPKLTYDRGRIDVTSFGKLFFRACVT